MAFRRNSMFVVALLVSLLLLTTIISPVHSTGDRWSMKKSISSARTYAGATALNGLIYVVGGLDASLRVLSSNEVYDPSSDTWTSLAPLPIPTDLAGVVSVNGRVYAIGGFQWHGNKDYSITGAVEVYDPQGNNWTSRTPIPNPTQGLMVAAVNGLIYAMGGSNAFGNENSTWVYNPQSDTWRQRAPMSTYDSSLAQGPDQVAVVDGKIYVFDQSEGSIGPNRPNDPKPMFNLVYDVAADMWAHWPALLTMGARGNPISLSGHSMIGIGTKILVIGGNDVGLWCTGQCSINPSPSPVTAYNFEYDTVTGLWSRRTDMLTSREGLVTASVDGTIYAIGGAMSNENSLFPFTTGYTDHNEAYTPCSGFCPPFMPSSASNYLTWITGGMATLGVASIGVVMWRARKKHEQRPRMRPLDPIPVST